MSIRNYFFILSVLVCIILIFTKLYYLFLLVIPIILIGFYDLLQTKHTILRIYPVIAHFRYIFEKIRPEIQQYFVESNLSGRPFNREFRDLVYQRAKNQRDTRPFGTQFDVYRAGYEWINHSLAPIKITDRNPRIKFGNSACKKSYLASPFNISAMSYGALSKNAIMALNKGAKLGNFFHNTGEGGLSQYHLKYEADIVWQIGSGYFGCRNYNGTFNEELFIQKSQLDVVKMIEIKLSQGAKPGHGGILPAAKLTQEIAEIRHVTMGKDVVSPDTHSEFNTPITLLKFVDKLRKLSNGKPIGFKLCIGNKSEFLGICKSMLVTNIIPDFITVDGAEGGTGASPIEFTNSIGTPLNDAVVFINNALLGIGLRDDIKIIASAKIISAFHITRVLSLGADTINSARGMMLALGCIQSRSCNTDNCPTGIATQNPARYKALNIKSKSQRVANFHNKTIDALINLIAACGINDLNQLKPKYIYRRIGGTEIANYEELYPSLKPLCLVNHTNVPKQWQEIWSIASAEKW